MAIRLTDRDVEVFEALHSARFLTTQQIQKLFWSDTEGAIGPLKACQRRLRLLTEHGFVRRIEQKVTRSEGSKPYLFALDENGAQILADELSLELSEINFKPAPAEDNYPFLDHLTATTDIRITLKQACELHNLEFVEWVDEKDLRSAELKDYVTLKGPDGSTIRAALVPDAYFVIGSGTRMLRSFLEVDRGTHTIRSKWNRGWMRKVLTYSQYFVSDAYTKRYGDKRIVLLTVTTTESRLNTMKEATEEAGGGGRFWFAIQENAADPHKLLSERIWHVAGRAEPTSLIPQTTTMNELQ